MNWGLFSPIHDLLIDWRAGWEKEHKEWGRWASGLPPIGMSDKPFGEAVADVHRDLKKQIQNTPIHTPEKPGGMDGSVKEQVISDLDGLIKKHEDVKKTWPETI